MKRTLLPEIFMEAICNNCIALNQYTFYLKQMNEEVELVQLEKLDFLCNINFILNLNVNGHI